MQRHRMEHLNTSETTNRNYQRVCYLGFLNVQVSILIQNVCFAPVLYFSFGLWFWKVFVISTCYWIQIYMYYLFFQKGFKEIKEIKKLQQNLMKSKPVTVKNHFKNLIAFYPICVKFFKEKYNQYNFFFQIEFLWLWYEFRSTYLISY